MKCDMCGIEGDDESLIICPDCDAILCEVCWGIHSWGTHRKVNK